MKHIVLQKKTQWIGMLLACLIALIFCAYACAEEVTIVASGYCGSETVNGIRNGNLTYQLDSNGKLTISGQGPMKELPGMEFWGSIHYKIQSVEIENGVTTISPWAFYDCSKLKSVTLPQSINEIGYRSFSYCENLRRISIPDGITKINGNTFEKCTGLRSVYLPNSVTEIDDHAFSYCSNLTSITLPEGLTKIGYAAFDSCSKLRTLHIPDSVTEIDWYAFRYCSKLTSVFMPKNLKKMGYGPFSGCFDLTHLVLPIEFAPTEELGSRTSTIIYCYQNSPVDEWAANYGYQIVYLDQMDLTQPVEFSLITPQTALFAGESLTITPCVFPAQANQNIQWSSSAPNVLRVENGVVTVVGDGTASITAVCGNMSASVDLWASATISPQQLSADSAFKAIDSSSFAGTKFKIVILPESCTQIGPGTFSNCSELEAVYIPSSVYSHNIKLGAFHGCEQLVIIGEAGSGAATYARNMNIPFYSRLPE